MIFTALRYCPVPCNEEKERKGKIEDPSGRDFSAKEKQGEVVVTLGLMW